jgi:flagellar hook assembly protein FlgD
MLEIRTWIGIAALLALVSTAAAADPLRSVAATQSSYAAPNPFHVGLESTAIYYRIATAGTVQVQVYTLQGGLVWQVSQQQSAAGPALRHVTWDGRNGAGTPVRNGVYVCRITSGKQSETFKIAVLR